MLIFINISKVTGSCKLFRPEFLTLPFQAFECNLAHVRPVGKSRLKVVYISSFHINLNINIK